MYKVFNDTQKIIIEKSDAIMDFGDAITICIRDLDKLPQIIDKHVFKSNSLDLVLLSEQVENLMVSFENLFIIHRAAGGWVFNAKGRLLMIKRCGKWDIPKGHTDGEESIEETAIREVEEETGVSGLKINSNIGISQHIYFHKQKPILKKTHWFVMSTCFEGELIPQTNENITKAKWINPEKIEAKLNKGWLSLLDFYLNHTVEITP